MKLISMVAMLLTAAMSGAAYGQITVVKYAVANAGSIKTGPILSTATVIGESVVGRFSSGGFSGNIGYLDEDDLLPTGITTAQPLLYQLQVSPNPNIGDFNVVVKAPQTGAIQLILTDAIGRTLEMRKAQLVTGENFFRYSGILTGICLIRLVSDKATQVEKITVLSR